ENGTGLSIKPLRLKASSPIVALFDADRVMALPGKAILTTPTLPTKTESTQRRSMALANLRGFAIVMVLSFHSFIAYNFSQPAAALPFDDPPYRWMVNPIIDSARWLGFDLFCAFQYSYLMHMMFFLSGMFVWPSLVGKRSWGFLQGRLIRLGVPWVFGVY